MKLPGQAPCFLFATFSPADFGSCPAVSLPWWTQPSETVSRNKAGNSQAAVSEETINEHRWPSRKKAPLTTPRLLRGILQ